MPICEISLLGTFGVRINGRAIPDRAWHHRRAAQLVKMLALADRHRLHRERVMDSLWPHLDADAAGANLRKAVHFARRAFGSDDAIGTTSEMIELWPGNAIVVDALRFERAASTLSDATGIAATAALYTGELLPEDRYAPWADEPRERLRLRLIHMFKRGALWERVLEIDPGDEEAHRALMQRALDTGDRSSAIRQFERLRERLRADLGMGPDAASVRLYEKALALEGREPPTLTDQARALLAWGIVHLNSGDLAEAERTAERARTIAIDAGLGREIGEASGLLGMIAHMQGRWKQLFHAEFIASVRRSPQIAASVFDAHLCLAEFSLCGPAGHQEIVGYAEELLVVAVKAGSVQGRALAELLLGEADLFADRLAAAEEHLRTAAALHEQTCAPSGQVVAMQRLAELFIARGQRWRANRLIRRALRLAQGERLAPHFVVRLNGTLIEATRDAVAAAASVSRADRALAGQSVCRPCSMGFRVAATMALARAGLIAEARRRLDEAERIAGMWPGGPWHAALWEARGVLRQAEGDREQAVALFKEAARRFANVDRPRDEARCRAAAGT
ncbi:MAG TPA: BTAD domain-containing putative transcriptional regulator [Gemmatimonadales bacterium]|nr:BTAD domain-containing putative transcriptional regulator [Gemmatimonadales bacterium]